MKHNYSIDDFKNIDFEETNEQEDKIIEFCTKLKSTQEILDYLEIDEDLESFQLTIDDMVDSGLLLLRNPSFPSNHPKQKYKQNRAIKEETKQTKRVLELINRFNEDKIITISKLQENAQEAYDFDGSELDKLWFNESANNGEGAPISEKTIRRDLDIIKSHFPRAFELVRSGIHGKSYYKSINKTMFDNFLDPKTLSLMVQTFNIAQRSNMFDSLDIREEDKRLLKKKAKEKSSVYEFKSKPFETKHKDSELFNLLEENIKDKKSILIDYEERENQVKKIEVKPYKIIFMNDNFYVACGVDNSFMYSLYRVSKILDYKDLGKPFKRDEEIENFIKDIQTPFSRYTKNYKDNMIEVVLEIDSSKAFHFKSKKQLSSQEILEEKENGNILLSFNVTQTREMEELVKKWIPFVKVIKPLSLKQDIERDIKKYMSL